MSDHEIETAAKRDCDWLLRSAVVRKLDRKEAEALIILAFTVGAAWALDRPDMVELARAQAEVRLLRRN